MKNKDSILTNSFVVCLIAMVCCGLWGSAFPSIKIGYKMLSIGGNDTAAQLFFAGIRFALAGIMVIAAGSFIQRKPLVPSAGSLQMIVKLSIFQTVLQYIFFYIGLAHTTSIKSSIIEGANVFVCIIIAGFIFHQEKVTANKIIGSVIGFTGVILVNTWGKGVDISIRFNGEGFILISTIAYAVSSVLIKEYSKKEDTVTLSGYQFLFGGFILALMGFLSGGRISIGSKGAAALLVYMAFISAAAYTLWGILLKYNSVSKVSVYGFMNPVFGVILSSLLLNEKQDMEPVVCVVSLLLVCIGIIIVNYSLPDKS